MIKLLAKSLIILALIAPNAVSAKPVSDPIEGLNRVIYKGNDVVDRIILVPLAKGYRIIIPKFGRERVSDFFENLQEPVTFVNSLLQGDIDNAADSFFSFVVNSSLGLGGFIDIAGYAGLDSRKEDFGQTLAEYGVGEGPFLMLPLAGPTNLRDLVGRIVDSFGTPTNYLDSDASLIINVTDVIDTREGLLDFTEDMLDSSFDPYATIRSAYTQSRRGAIKDKSRKSKNNNKGYNYFDRYNIQTKVHLETENVEDDHEENIVVKSAAQRSRFHQPRHKIQKINFKNKKYFDKYSIKTKVDVEVEDAESNHVHE